MIYGTTQAIAEIKEKVDIYALIAPRVALQRVGSQWKGLCPFHEEKTPSFVCYPDGRYHCFGCQENGDVIEFLMRADGLDFRGALEKLAGLIGVTLPACRKLKPAEQRAAKYRERLAEANEAATLYYTSRLLKGSAGEYARQYIAERGLNRDTVERFGLGYAPDSSTALLNYLTERGYTPDELVAAGLCGRREDGTYYDRFRDRLVFPLRAKGGSVVGFGGRALSAKQEAKYINTSATILFEKGQTLYGLDQAAHDIREGGVAVVVEGYMDVLACHQAGYRNVIAPMGTALTAAHVESLQRLARHVLLAFDSDVAGKSAVLRVADMLLGQKVDVSVIALPHGLDPDQVLLREDGPAQWKQLMAEAQPIEDMMVASALSGHDLQSGRGKRDALLAAAARIAAMPESVMRQHYSEQVAEVLRLTPTSVMEAVQSARANRSPGIKQRAATYAVEVATGELIGATKSDSDLLVAEEMILTLMLRYPQLVMSNMSPDRDDYMSSSNRIVHTQLSETVRLHWEAAMQVADSYEGLVDGIQSGVRSQLGDDLGRYMDDLIQRYATMPTTPEHDRGAALRSLLMRLRKHNDSTYLIKLTRLMEQAEAGGDEEMVDRAYRSMLEVLNRRQSYESYEHGINPDNVELQHDSVPYYVLNLDFTKSYSPDAGDARRMELGIIAQVIRELFARLGIGDAQTGLINEAQYEAWVAAGRPFPGAQTAEKKELAYVAHLAYQNEATAT